MFGFGRKKEEPESTGTADTFVEAIGGGWGDPPRIIPADGGEYADYVGGVLEGASEYAHDQEVGIGEEFDYLITNIPRGISNPLEIMAGLLKRAPDYGLSVDFMRNETIRFIRDK